MKDFLKLLAVGISLILLVVVTSCSPQRRFTRLITKHPELIQTDTIIRIDTVKVVVPKVEKDTAFLEKYLSDTVVIEKDRLKVKLWKVYDTIKVNAECAADTIEVVRKVEIPVYYYEKEKSFWQKLGKSIKNLMWLLVLIAVGIVIFQLIKIKPWKN
jgi:predicted DNA binding protein